MQNDGTLRNPARRLLRLAKRLIVPDDIAPSQLRLAVRNTTAASVLLLCIWGPVILLQVVDSQSGLIQTFTVDAGHQAAEVTRSLRQSLTLLQQVAVDLEDVSQSGSGDIRLSTLSRTLLDRLFALDAPSCSGYAFVHDKVRAFASKNATAPSGTFPDGTRLNLTQLPGSDSHDGSKIPAILGPLRSQSGETTVLLTATFRLPQQTPAFGVLVLEYNLDQLMKQHSLLIDQFPVLQEICSKDGVHLAGTPGLLKQYPVLFEVLLPGQHWQVLTVPRKGWFSFLPPVLFFFSGLGLLMLGGSCYSVWRVTLSHSQLIRELEEKSQALDAANLQMRDDLERIQTAQRQLAVSELRTRLIYEQIPVGVGLLEAESGRLLAVNPEACRILAASEPELQQRRLQGLLRQSPTDSSSAANATLMPSGFNSLRPGEYFVTHGTDGVRCVQLALAPIVRQPGEMDRRLAVLQDVTERWLAHEELRQHEERIRVLADTLPGPLLFIDSDERCQFASDAMLQLLKKVNGPSFDSPLGRRTEELVPPVIHQFLQPWITQALNGESPQFETNAEMEELGLGAWMFFHRPLRQQGRIVGFFAFMLEISQQRENERQRRELDSRMADAQRMETVGTLAGGVAHEFNNMLQVVLGFADVLLVHCAPDPFAVENLNHIRHAGRRASDLTKQLLAFARFQPGTPVKVNFADFVPAALKLLKHAGGDTLQIRWECQQPLDETLVDPGHLELILANLILNARHAMDGRGIIDIHARNLPANASAEPGLPAAGQPSVLLSVCDTGCGMTPEVQARMFDPFFTTRAVGKGAGLGLSTVYGIVVQAGGRIDVRSHPGRGTAIHVLLPSVGECTPPPPAPLQPRLYPPEKCLKSRTY